MSGLEFHDLIGVLGVGLILLCYFLLQIGKLDARQLRYSSGNLLGACLILFSLYFEFNFASMLIEGFWVLISLIGMARYIRSRRTDCRSKTSRPRVAVGSNA